MEPFSAAGRAEFWQDRLATIARNITDFAESEDLRRIKSRLADAAHPYRGVTLDAARQAVAAVDGLWQDFLLLSRVIDEAADLARRGGLFSRTDDQVRRLIEGPSIRLPPVSVPVRRRGLLDAAEAADSVTPAAVLASMTAAFDHARHAVSAITQAETITHLKLGALRHDWERFFPAGKTGLEPGMQGFDFGLMAAEAEGDPLDAGDRIAALARAMATLRSRRVETERMRARLLTELQQARAALAELRDVASRIGPLRAEHAARIEAQPGAGPLPAGEAPDSLGLWLDRLEAIAAGARGEAASVGLARWREACRASRTAGQACLDALDRDLKARDDLRGRFRALRAKAGALLRRGAVDPVLAALEAEVATEVDRTPCRIDAARRLIESYERSLAASGRAPLPSEPARPA